MQILQPHEGVDLVEFIRARLREKMDAQLSPETAWHAHTCVTPPTAPPAEYLACACGVPARVLRSITATTGIVDDYARALRRWERKHEARCPEAPHEEAERTTAERAVRLLAVEHDTHPRFRTEWRIVDPTIRLTGETTRPYGARATDA